MKQRYGNNVRQTGAVLIKLILHRRGQIPAATPCAEGSGNRKQARSLRPSGIPARHLGRAEPLFSAAASPLPPRHLPRGDAAVPASTRDGSFLTRRWSEQGFELAVPLRWTSAAV